MSMKEILDNDMNNIDEVQMNTLDDMGIGFGNSLYRNSNKDKQSDVSHSDENTSTEVEKVIDEITKSEDLVYSNLEEVMTSNHMYKNIESDSDSDNKGTVDITSRQDDVIDTEVTKEDIIDIDENIKDIQEEIKDVKLNTESLEKIDDTKLNEECLEDNVESKEQNVDDIEKKAYEELSDISKMLVESVAEVEKAIEVEDDKVIIDGDVDKTSHVFGYQFVDVEEANSKAVSGKIEEVTNKDVDFISDDIAPYISKIEPTEKKRRKNNSSNNSDKGRMYKKIAIIAAVFTIVGTSIFLGVRGLASKINFTDFSDTVEQEEQFDTESVLSDNAEVVKVNEFNWDMIKGDPTYDENIYNILIVGGDIAGTKDARGNSDTLIIVSIDKNTKSIKLSSIMRDTYVPIPGYSDNKINSAYATGGVPLIKQVIEENFKVTIDSTVVVNYSTFVKAIQKLGGVKGVVLNGAEARFINRECNKHGHSSNLSEGTFDLDAYQALHFARIRKISSDIYGKDDFGRTARQRYVINQLFKQYKDLNYAQLAGVLTSVMGELQVDEVLKKDLFLLAQVALKFDADTLGEFRLPMDDAYSFASVPIPGSGMNMSVVKIDDYWQTNVDALHQFIYGTTEY